MIKEQLVKEQAALKSPLRLPMTLDQLAQSAWRKEKLIRSFNEALDEDYRRCLVERHFAKCFKIKINQEMIHQNGDEKIVVNVDELEILHDYSNSYRLMGRCPACNERCRSKSFYGLAGLGDLIENFQPDTFHVCKKPNSEKIKSVFEVVADSLRAMMNEELDYRENYREDA